MINRPAFNVPVPGLHPQASQKMALAADMLLRVTGRPPGHIVPLSAQVSRQKVQSGVDIDVFRQFGSCVPASRERWRTCTGIGLQASANDRSPLLKDPDHSDSIRCHGRAPSVPRFASTRTQTWLPAFRRRHCDTTLPSGRPLFRIGRSPWWQAGWHSG